MRGSWTVEFHEKTFKKQQYIPLDQQYLLLSLVPHDSPHKNILMPKSTFQNSYNGFQFFKVNPKNLFEKIPWIIFITLLWPEAGKTRHTFGCSWYSLTVISCAVLPISSSPPASLSSSVKQRRDFSYRDAVGSKWHFMHRGEHQGVGPLEHHSAHS